MLDLTGALRGHQHHSDYEYKCDSCGNKFEKLVRRSDETAGLAWPFCGNRHLSQEYSTFAAHAGSAPSRSEVPMCPSGGVCSNPGFCNRN